MITKNIQQAIFHLDQGDLIGMPTETVYGLAANALDEYAVKMIFEMKQRPFYNPLIVHIRSVEALDEVAMDIPSVARKLAGKFWPGSLTMLLKKRSIIPDVVTAGKDTVAVRIPNHPMALELLSKIPYPIAAPSANPFCRVSPTEAIHVENYFGSDLPLILDGGSCSIGVESTIVGFEGEEVLVFRLGGVSLEEIAEVEEKVKLVNHTKDSPEAPGMMKKHYAPRTKLLLANDLLLAAEENKDRKIGFLLLQKKLDPNQFPVQYILSETGDLKEAASKLYRTMMELDSQGLDLIIAERMPEYGLGSTMNDKLTRASE